MNLMSVALSQRLLPTCTRVPQKDSTAKCNEAQRESGIGWRRASQVVIAARDNDGLIVRKKEENLCTDTNSGHNLQAPSNSVSAQPFPS
jgi:hypothetical protein